MRKFIIVSLIILVIATAVFFWHRQKKTAEAIKVERSIFGGLTRNEFTLKVKNEWRKHWIELTEKYILDSPEGATWRTTIENQLVASSSTTPLTEAVYDASLMAWSKENPKAWDKVWSRGWLTETYVKGVMNLDPNKTEINNILKTV